MIKRLSLWGVGLLAIVLAAQFLLRGPPPAEQSPRVESPSVEPPSAEPPREQLPAVDPLPERAPLRTEPAPQTTEPAPLEAIARNAPVAPTAPTAAAPEVSRRFVFDCGNDLIFMVRTVPGEATLFPPQALGGQAVTLPQVETASGTRYAEGGVSYSSNGGLASFEFRDRLFADCTSNPGGAQTAEVRRRGVTFRARGNEPSWLLEVSPDRIELVTELGTRRVDFPYREPTVAGTRSTYRAFVGTQELVAVIDSAPCYDTMSGERFEATATVTFESTTFHGCGQAP
jgi:uncharacterized membrane protein/membrane-bound inhibitor of C-type lysozyme